ncbi:uncharacterized protein VTP21DRAFT_10764 [Calcarisporiella thermophila]|uniref:uncharacterized protein n=1 Tax=Calcarisporiella thermophila TaxID=911321 RepID=UPI003743121D
MSGEIHGIRQDRIGARNGGPELTSVWLWAARYINTISITECCVEYMSNKVYPDNPLAIPKLLIVLP